MTGFLFDMFGISLGLTLLLEIPVGHLLGMRGGKYRLLMLLVNVLTNPAAVLLCWLGVSQLPVEILVAAVEFWVYRWFSREESWRVPNPLKLSLICNGISWTGGLLFDLLGGSL